MTCADFSARALRRAEELAQAVGVTLATVQADSRALPPSLHDCFDLVYVTVGAICWIDDLDLWMRQVALALRAGGRLVMVEIHPLYQMVGGRVPDLVVDFPYGGGASATYVGQGTYADPHADFVTSTTNYAHSIGDIVSGAVRAGLRVDELVEHVESEINPRGDDVLQRGDDGRWRLLLGRGEQPDSAPAPLPVYLTLLATKV